VRRNSDLPAQSDEFAALCRSGGLLVSVCFSTAFWVLALIFGSTATGVPLSTLSIMALTVVIAALCFLGLAVVIGGSRAPSIAPAPRTT
jgi:hypothetical protein